MFIISFHHLPISSFSFPHLAASVLHLCLPSSSSTFQTPIVPRSQSIHQHILSSTHLQFAIMLPSFSIPLHTRLVCAHIQPTFIASKRVAFLQPRILSICHLHLLLAYFQLAITSTHPTSLFLTPQSTTCLRSPRDASRQHD